jgi:hypothetical protein
MRAIPLPPSALLAGLLLGACAGHMKKPEQGLEGAFLAYGPPREQVDCAPFKTQMEKDDCRRMNERVVEEPLGATIKIRDLQTGEIRAVALDAEGAYRAVLAPGDYAVCLEGECSDPITVPMGGFVRYGQRLPRSQEAASAAPTDSAKSAGPSVGPPAGQGGFGSP